MKLEMRIERWGKTVVAQVLKMEESLRCSGLMFEKNKIEIRSEGHPEIYTHALYIAGECDRDDDNIVWEKFETENKAQEYLERLLDTVKSFNEEIDWSKVAVDTKVLVSDDNDLWERRYFAKYENGKVWVWMDGASSWTIDSSEYTADWKYAKLAE